MMCLRVVLFGFILFGTLCTSWTCVSISFTMLRIFLSLFFQIGFQFPPSGKLDVNVGMLEVVPGALCVILTFFDSFFFLLL